jgi:trehalose 6-phosphate synthase/phosphatase
MLCKEIDMKLYIIANRLPVKVAGTNGKFAFSRSEGGLATGLDSLQTSYEKHWIGWPGICANEEKDQQEINEKLQEMNFHPVFLSEKQIENYYEGYSNSTIWPLCHYFYAYTLYKNCFWQSYQQVNRLFYEEICRLVRPGDKVWIQDYQLMLLPGMLRKIYPELCIGYFHHIPFPSYELFRILPERAEILKGLLGADFIAFHTHDYMRHFISAVERVLHLDFKLDEVQINNRVTRVEALPMGINYESYHKASENKEVHQAIERTRKLFGEHKLILSVDRLDYSKGILHRLRGFATFLEHHAEYHGKVTLAMVIVPSRDHVGSYAELKTKIDEEIGSINGRYSTMNWTPVCYFYHGFSLEELTAMYYVADIALVTPLRDGMNLVAKEYVATKCDNPGVLILSEMAGAAVELTDAIQINPNDTEQIENAICQALEMPEEEQKQRLQRMQSILSVQTVNKWAADFVNELNATCMKNDMLRKKRIVAATIAQIKLKYNQAKQRLILLDYDGTLTALKPRPEDAQPTPELISILQQLASDPANHIVINSGRDHFTLEKWLGSLPVSMAAEPCVTFTIMPCQGSFLHFQMGNDTTDEDMFQALPKSAIAIKIGSVSEAANYHLSAQSDVLPFLRSLLGKQKTATKKGSIKNRLTFAFDFLKDLLKTQ